ncbi:MAG: phage holin family protein [Bacteroidales bacterium]|nr:phage holin family protein [Bacteroidales bacterium]
MQENEDFNFSGEIGKLIQEIKEYIELKYDIARLDFTEKIVRIISVFFGIMTFFVIVPGVLMFFSFALAYYLGDVLGANYWGFMIVGGIYLFFGIIFIIFKKKFITKPIIKTLTEAILKETD